MLVRSGRQSDVHPFKTIWGARWQQRKRNASLLRGGSPEGWKLLPPPEPNVLGGASHSLRPRPKWTVIGGGPHNKEPRTVLMHQGNLPSIDLAEGRVVSASLDGWVGLADCTVKTPRHSTPAGDQSGASSLADAITRSSLDAASRSLPTVCGAAHEFRAPGATMWGACWLPLHSVRSLVTDTLGEHT